MPEPVVNLLGRAQDTLDARSQEEVQQGKKNWKTKNKNVKINVSNINIFYVENFNFLVHMNTSQIYNTLLCNIVFYAQNRSANVFCGFESNKKAMQKQAATKC